jgi:hypothetical protein
MIGLGAGADGGGAVEGGSLAVSRRTDVSIGRRQQPGPGIVPVEEAYF